MSEIVQKWLSAKLGIFLDINTISFGEITKDGALLAQLLHSYGLINTVTLNSIHKTNDSSLALKNLKVLNETFKTLGIICREKNLELISKGNDSAALKLLYQLYLKLFSKSEVYFIVNDDTGKKEDGKVKEPALKKNYFDLFQTSDDDLKWYENKYKDIVTVIKKDFKRCAERENVGLNKIQSMKDNINIPGIDLRPNYFQDIDKYPINIMPDVSVDDLNGTCGPDLKKAKQYVAYLKKKHERIAQYNKASKYMQKILLDGVMVSVRKKEENEIKTFLTSKLLKQTQQEKQMAKKQLEIQAQRNLMIHNRLLENQLFLEKQINKIREEHFRKEHDVLLKEKKYKMGKERLLELHERLYKEKLRRNHEENRKTCFRICEDLVDLAVKVANYRTDYNCDVPFRTWNEWKNLFCLELPIFDTVEESEDIILAEEIVPSEVLTAERYRQDGLDEQDMLAYHNLYYPWDVDMTLYVSVSKPIEIGLNILGFIVHRLLLTKYPMPKYPGIPELPFFTTTASLNGVLNNLVLAVLKELLDKKNIILISPDDAINSCLNCYKNEATDTSDSVLQEGNVTERSEKEHKKHEKSPKGKKSAKKKPEVVEKPVMVSKELQTPRIFPGDDIKLTRQGELGKVAYETLHLGLTVSNFLLVQILVEYLKTLSDKCGWVLLNYPANINDAVIFESILSGRYEVYKEYLESDITFISNLTPAERDEIFKLSEDRNEKKRLSNIVPNTLPVQEGPVSRSYLTSYVDLVKNLQCNSPEEGSLTSLECVESVKDFYKNLGCFTSINYTELDALTIRNIIAAVMKDDVFANETYETVIEEALKAAQEREEAERKKKEEAGGKKTKEKGGKKKGKEKKGKEKKDKGKKGKGKKDKEKKNKESSKISTIPENDPVKHETSKIKQESEPEPEKEEKRTFVALQIPDKFQITLASFWENLEEIYVNDFKQCFFVRRVQNNLIAPYCKRITTYMTSLINKPDDKQTYLHKFQTFYNSIESDLLLDKEIKTEIHFRIDQFRSILWNISYEHMRECEEERVRIIKMNWFCKQAAEVVNIFISALQLEIERCVRTLQLLEDYYVMMISHEIPAAKFYNSMLPSFKYDEKSNALDVIQLAFEYAELDLSSNIFTEAMKGSYSLALSTVTATYHTILKNVKKHETQYAQKPMPKKGKKSKTSVAAEESQYLFTAVEEWKKASEGEFQRTKLRLTVIYTRAVQEIDELLSDGLKLFRGISEKINKRYQEEINSIKKACIYLRKAVESCKPIAPQLILKGTEFNIKENVLLLDEITECLNRKHIPIDFSLLQLLRLFNIFNDLAPSGFFSIKSFTYLLEDMISNADIVAKPLVPPYWTELKSSQVCRLICEVYGDTEYVNWKDFLILIMEIPFPTESEILETYWQFQKIDIDKEHFIKSQCFDRVQFWFENDDDIPEQRISFFKKVLRHMFTVGNCISYPDLLLSFCKDTNEVLGFAKALELCLGRFVCWNEQIGKRFFTFWQYQHQWNKKMSNNINVCDKHYNSKNYFKNDTDSYFEQNSMSSSYIEMEEKVLRGEDECYCFDVSFHCPMMCYFLSFDIILNVLLSSLPWYCKLPCLGDYSIKEYLEVIYENFRSHEFDDHVFAHEFLNDKSFKEILTSSKKFVIKSPNEIVLKLIDTCTCEEEIVEEKEEKEEELEELEKDAEIIVEEESGSEVATEEVQLICEDEIPGEHVGVSESDSSGSEGVQSSNDSCDYENYDDEICSCVSSDSDKK